MNETRYSVEKYKNRIMTFLNQGRKKPIPKKDLAAKCKSNKGGENFYIALDELCSEGIIFERKKGFVSCEKYGYFTATITRLNKTFGFAEKTDDKSEVFIPGKFLMGAMPQDKVLISLIESRSGSPEGEVLSILEENLSQMTGTVVFRAGSYFIIPDTMAKSLIRVDNMDNVPFEEGDKVLAEIIQRGSRHSEHRARIIMAFGSAENAVSCANSILAVNGIVPEFPFKALKEARKIAEAGIQEYEYNNREDLRDECIFTIDSAEAKDLDDAVSISKHEDHYILGVHIADVSYYVKGNSALDKEALNRGTSIYYANKVVPMLPKELSNGICSLNPNEDRLTFSVFLKVDFEGNLKNYTFKKTVINSKIKGIYSEINTILSGETTPEILEKYAHVMDSIILMNELADLLIACKKRRGAPQIETVESKLIIDENDVCIGVTPRVRGKSEMIIEEFMLLANKAAANYARIKEVPFIYRVHEEPTLEKAEKLKEILLKIGVPFPNVDSFKPAHLAQILDNARESPMFPVINTIILRSMAKAKYAPEPIGHFGLALADYAHFTSPIRRYPDLSIHRILSDTIMGYDTKWLEKRYAAFTANSSEKSSRAELTAMNVERECEDCYKAEYMQKHIGEVYEGLISSVVEFGIYVMLDNTVEGLIHINSFPPGNYYYDGFMSITEQLSNKKYTLGDKVRIKCVKATVSTGDIDFVFAEESELQSED